MVDLKKMYNEKKYVDLIAIVNATDDPTLDDIEKRAEAYYATGDLRRAVDDFKQILAARSTSARYALFQKTRSAIGRLKLPHDEAKTFWRECSDPVSIRVGAVADKLKGGETEGTIADFFEIVDEVLGESPASAPWKHAFEILVGAIRGDEIEPLEPSKVRKKVIVSGTGWSGSGALFDYLKEFPDIFPVVGESSALEGRGGFRGFLEVSTNDESCKSHSIDFFFKNMFGFLPMQTPSCYPELRSARANTLGAKTAERYAAGAPHVVRAVAHLLQVAGREPERVEDQLQQLCDAISEKMIAFMAPDDKVVLLDNCIHAYNIFLCNYLSNTTVMCCFRDPRSNYVALKREFAGFDKTVSEFVKADRRKRKVFLDHFDETMRSRLAANQSHVEVVMFEQFLVSAPYRERLSAILDLNHSSQKKFAHFQPWISFRNAQIHLDYEPQEEIQNIKNSLPEYCVELSAGYTCTMTLLAHRPAPTPVTTSGWRSWSKIFNFLPPKAVSPEP